MARYRPDRYLRATLYSKEKDTSPTLYHKNRLCSHPQFGKSACSEYAHVHFDDRAQSM